MSTQIHLGLHITFSIVRVRWISSSFLGGGGAENRLVSPRYHFKHFGCCSLSCPAVGFWIGTIFYEVNIIHKSIHLYLKPPEFVTLLHKPAHFKKRGKSIGELEDP